MTIAVTGATGHLGGHVLSSLDTRGAAAVALARDPSRLPDRDARAFDYDRPETLEPALSGIDTLLLISGSEIGKRGPQHRAVIDAARAAGVGHVVYTSVLGADASQLFVAPEHRETEAALRESGLPHTLLRNGWYLENYEGGIEGALATGALVGAAGDGRIDAAPRADYAEAAARVLTDPSLQGRTWELAGRPGFTMTELARAVSAATGRDIPYRDLSREEYAATLRDAGLPEGLAGALAETDALTAEGALASGSDDLATLLGRAPTPMQDWVAARLG